MFLFRNGSRVHIGDQTERIVATVLGVSLTGHDYAKIGYLCSWWDGKSHKEEWLDCELVEPFDETPSSIELKMFGYADDGEDA